MDQDELALEVRRLRAELRDTLNRFAEEGARLNTEVAFWKLKFFEACALIPEADLPAAYHLEGARLPVAELTEPAWRRREVTWHVLRGARQDPPDRAVGLAGR